MTVERVIDPACHLKALDHAFDARIEHDCGHAGDTGVS
jgi:hypothetical protein